MEALLDLGTFNEIEPFITHQGDELNLLKDKFYGGGVITGYGQIDGRTVYLYSQDFTIYGGTLSEMQSHKICRVMDLAVRNGVPFISLIDSGGAAYSPALTDLVIMVEKQSFMFLTGPEVIKAVTGEVIDSESLGGSNVHNSVSGVAHLSVKSEMDALQMARHFLSYLPSNNVENPLRNLCLSLLPSPLAPLPLGAPQGCFAKGK